MKCPKCGYEWSQDSISDAFEEENDPQTDFIEFEAMGEGGLADVALGGSYSERNPVSGTFCPKCHYRIS
jgi:hypothetical protein